MNNDNRNSHNRRHRFAHERLDAYPVALRLFRDVHRLAVGLPTGHSGLAQQMRRAASSIVLELVPQDSVETLKTDAGRVAAMLTGLANRELRLAARN